MTARERLQLTAALVLGGVAGLALAIQTLTRLIIGGGLDLRMDEFLVPVDSSLIGRPLTDLNLRPEHGLLIVAVRHSDGAWLHSPGPEVQLEGGETVVVIGKPGGVGQLLRSEGQGLRPDGG